MNRTRPLRCIRLIACLAASCAAQAIFADAGGPDFFRVRNVKAADTLNVRAEPNAKSTTVGELAASARHLRNLGCVSLVNGKISEHGADKPGHSVWCKISDGKITGWANARFLAEDEG